MLLGLLPTSSVFAAQSVMITVTKGFGLSLFASDLGDIKQMTLGDDGTLFVGSQKSGTVYALVDSDQNGQVDKRYLIARGLEYPEALAFHDGALYVTEEDRIIRFEEIESRLRRPGRAREVYSNLPSLDKKYSRAMRFGPDDRLYVSIGSPCNVCEAASPFSSILAIDVDSGASEQIALGLRSVTGFDWSPETNKLWFADLGRNWMGDNIPADEINRVELKGSHYGFPYLHGSDVVEPAYDKPKNLNVIVPEFELPAHVAPTGLSFYRGEQFPERYRNQIFVAENGSWNRSSKVGYQIVMLEIEDDKVNKRETVVSFLDGEFPVARPFDVINAPDGSMYISDDLKGNIYRLFYNTAEQSQESN
ncbi:PQQ-dependent sugar dehydrogenase [Shewanella saliphila]|uniref:L-sorbosone dehydrogenase n=2 Tax=Shewanella saliphila TaxID=2282698 RepID=A0ABQ2QC60_9GAMM|nr:PQQ-dependent sugar dehydrogenase [Shewanella saliphila]MCL1103116.1 PQQ-dependent sugar dehydrogenase [Shewanella saliphila]GGP65793.1 L-sorbosone dehydrogenase [Shewanella saliphila]